MAKSQTAVKEDLAHAQDQLIHLDCKSLLLYLGREKCSRLILIKSIVILAQYESTSSKTIRVNPIVVLVHTRADVGSGGSVSRDEPGRHLARVHVVALELTGAVLHVRPALRSRTVQPGTRPGAYILQYSLRKVSTRITTYK